MVRDTNPDEWPDLEMDRQAWQKARSEFPNAPVSVVAARAQKIKEAQAGGTEPLDDKADLLNNDKGG
jgi:hypothetical protein